MLRAACERGEVPKGGSEDSESHPLSSVDHPEAARKVPPEVVARLRCGPSCAGPHGKRARSKETPVLCGMVRE